LINLWNRQLLFQNWRAPDFLREAVAGFGGICITGVNPKEEFILPNDAVVPVVGADTALAPIGAEKFVLGVAVVILGKVGVVRLGKLGVVRLGKLGVVRLGKLGVVRLGKLGVVKPGKAGELLKVRLLDSGVVGVEAIECAAWVAGAFVIIIILYNTCSWDWLWMLWYNCFKIRSNYNCLYLNMAQLVF